MKKTVSNSNLFEFISQRLADNAKKITFGTCSVTLILHNGQITKCDYSQTELTRFEVEQGEKQ